MQLVGGGGVVEDDQPSLAAGEERLGGRHGVGLGQVRTRPVTNQGPVLGGNELRALGVDPGHELVLLPVSGEIAQGESGLAKTTQSGYGGDRGLAVLLEVCVEPLEVLVSS